MKRDRIKRSDLIRIFCRSLFIQGSWNFKSMIGLGFCFCSIPIAKRLYKDREEQTEFLKRHLLFFNAHPYFATICVGACANLEEKAKYKEQGWVDLRPISVFKERMSGPLGSVGDQIFWSGMKPLAAVIGVIVAVSFGWIAIPIFLIFYNIPHFYVRIKGLALGYKLGFDVVSVISMRRLQKYKLIALFLGSLATGVCIMALAKWKIDGELLNLFPFVLSMLLTYILLKNKIPISLILVLVSVVTIIFELIV